MLDINATSVAIVLNFIILMYVLNYFLYGPTKKILSDRRKYINDTISEADVKTKAGEAFLEESRASIAKGNAEAREIIEKAEAAAARMREEQVSRTAKDIEELKKRADAEIGQFKAEAKKQMVEETAKLSVMIAEKIIRKNLDHKSQRAIVDDAIRDIGN